MLVQQFAQPHIASGQPCGQVCESPAHGERSSGGTGSHGAAGAGGGMRAPAAEQERNGAPVADPASGG
jgi:hypothetical protein